MTAVHVGIGLLALVNPVPTDRPKAAEPVRVEVPMKDGSTRTLTGRDAVLYCAHADRADDLGRLLAEGHDINRPHGDAGWTFLHSAASQGSRKAVAVLLAHGADAGARTKTGQTPLDVARAAERKAVVDALLAHAAR